MQPGKQDMNVEARSGPAGLHRKAGSLVHTAVAASVPTAAAAQAAAAGAAVLGQRMKLTSKRNFRRTPYSNALSQLPYQLQSPRAHRQCATSHAPASMVDGRLSMVERPVKSDHSRGGQLKQLQSGCQPRKRAGRGSGGEQERCAC